MKGGEFTFSIWNQIYRSFGVLPTKVDGCLSCLNFSSPWTDAGGNVIESVTSQIPHNSKPFLAIHWFNVLICQILPYNGPFDAFINTDRMCPQALSLNAFTTSLIFALCPSPNMHSFKVSNSTHILLCC